MTLYKYGDAACIDYWLDQKGLRFSSFDTLNDLNEVGPRVDDMLHDASLEVAKHYWESYPIYRQLQPNATIQQFARWLFYHPEYGSQTRIQMNILIWKIVQSRFRRAGILSLTSRKDNLLMWAHYADKATGLCIGFDPESPVLKNSYSTFSGLAGPNAVKYSLHRTRLDDVSPNERIADVVLTKSLEWQYEREYRCVRDLEVGETQAIINFNPEDVKEIIVGMRMPTIQMRKCILLKELYFQDAALLVAVPDTAAYKMSFYDMPTASSHEHFDGWLGELLSGY